MTNIKGKSKMVTKENSTPSSTERTTEESNLIIQEDLNKI